MFICTTHGPSSASSLHHPLAIFHMIYTFPLLICLRSYSSLLSIYAVHQLCQQKFHPRNGHTAELFRVAKIVLSSPPCLVTGSPGLSARARSPGSASDSRIHVTQITFPLLGSRYLSGKYMYDISIRLHNKSARSHVRDHQ